MYKGRTDLVVESHELYIEEYGPSDIDGVYITEKDYGEINVSRVYISTEQGSRALGKPIGHYTMCVIPTGIHRRHKSFEHTVSVLTTELSRLINLDDDKTVLVVGLGNQHITADALGPKVVKSTLISRHLFSEIPEELQGGIRPVAAVSPGVLGLTGIETAEIVRGVVDRIHPDLIIAIDALASRNIERISRTIQLSDSGIIPGGGVKNARSALTQETLGVPVIAIGVPTVIDASTIANETIDLTLSMLRKLWSVVDGEELVISDSDRGEIIEKLLTAAYTETLVVTPKDIDSLIDDISSIIANAINIALHKGLTQQDIDKYL